MKWYIGQVFEGHKVGRKIGFPTINLDPHILPKDQEEGVYASLVNYKGNIYTGALYLGPRQVFNETKIVLEIFLLNFDSQIYGEEIPFLLVKKVRGLVDLPSVEALKDQMAKDVKKIKAAVSSSSR